MSDYVDSNYVQNELDCLKNWLKNILKLRDEKIEELENRIAVLESEHPCKCNKKKECVTTGEFHIL